MSFLESVKRKEQEKRRASAWSQAVGQLSRFIRQYMRFAERGSGLFMTSDLLRVGDLLLDRLTLYFDGETVTATPMPLADIRAGEGGCVEIQSTNGTTYCLLWDGASPSTPEHWRIVRVDDHQRMDKAIDEASSRDSFEKLEPLSERSLDQALGHLFGLTSNGLSRSPETGLHPSAAKRIVSYTLMDKRGRIRAT